MKRNTTIALQAIIVLSSLGILVLMLWEPHLEGRNAQATFREIYYEDFFLAYAYIGSIPFFAALLQAFRALGYAGQNNRLAAIKALRTIKYCVSAFIGFVAGGEIFIMLSDSDDPAGGVFMGVLATLGAIAMAIAAAKLERNLRNAAGE